MSYNLTISAEDAGSPPLVGTANLVISVTDVNDNAPVFVSNQDTFTVVEVLLLSPLRYSTYVIHVYNNAHSL